MNAGKADRATIKIASLIGVILMGCIPFLAERFSFESRGDGKTLRVVFFDVGQGDSIFVESPTGKQVLIDGGVDATVLRRLGGEMGYWDRTIDMVVATHEDRDHVGGLPDVFNRYSVATFLRTENQGESSEAHIIDDLASREGSEIIFARRGMVFDLGASTTLEVLFPDRDPSMLESNTSSIVLRLDYKDTEFILTGDAPDDIEDYLVILDGEELQGEVLKLGHHGSRTSSSELFLRAVKPKYAIVSAEKDSRYGHPHTEVVERLQSLSIPMIATAEEGNIVFRSDGLNLWRQ